MIWSTLDSVLASALGLVISMSGMVVLEPFEKTCLLPTVTTSGMLLLPHST